MRRFKFVCVALAGIGLSNCASAPDETAPPRPQSAPPAVAPVTPPPTTVAPTPPVVRPLPTPPATQPVPVPAPKPLPPPADLVPLRFSAVDFSELPDWGLTDVGAARRAFVRSCALIVQRPATAALSQAVSYGGKIGDWAKVCQAAGDTQIDDRAFWESQFQVWTVEAIGEVGSRLTAYYEPIMDARRAPDSLHSEPIQARPADMLDIDLGAFDPALRPRTLVGRMEGTKIVPYPARAEITPQTAPVLAWGEPGEVLSLQIQGSGRLVFEDGAQLRAAFAAHNGQKFASNAQELIRRGHLPPNGASMDAVKAWLRDANPQERREVLNVNPRTVFFKLQPILDSGAGPLGGQGLPLEPNGSLAVDTAYHPYGVPIFLSAEAPRVALSVDKTLRRLVIAQDTGGAIKGPIRGDLYWGTGPEAGTRADRINHDTKFWVLLPKGLIPQADGG